MDLFGSSISVFCCQSLPIDVLIMPWRRLKPRTPKHPRRVAAVPAGCSSVGSDPRAYWHQQREVHVSPGTAVAAPSVLGQVNEMQSAVVPSRTWCLGWNFALGAVQGHAGADSGKPLWRWWQSNTDIAPEQGKILYFLLQKQN